MFKISSSVAFEKSKFLNLTLDLKELKLILCAKYNNNCACHAIG